MHLGEVGRRRGIVPLLDLGPGVRIVVQPLDDSDPHDADGAEREPTVGQLGRLDDLGDGAHTEAHVATADLAPPLDEDDAELAGRHRGSRA